MDPLIVAIIVIALLLICLVAGVGIGISLMLISVLGIWLSLGSMSVAIGILGTTAYCAIKDYAFAVVPLFVIMGLFANMAGASADLYDTSNALLYKVRGGVAIATVISNAVFAAITGVSIASAAVFTKIAVPEMTRLGYEKKFSMGTIAGSSVLGMLIPPSVLMIIYGSLAEQSIGKLFIAGIVPGVVLTLLYVLLIIILTKFKPELAGLKKDGSHIIKQDKFTWKILLKPWGIVLLIILVMGGIWGGLFTPTEAGGIGALGALLLVFLKRKFTFRKLWDALSETGKSTGSILFLLIAAQMFSRMLAVTGFIPLVTKGVMSLNLSAVGIICIFCTIHLAMGAVLDSTSILLLTMPIMVPIVRALGYDLIWYGILAIVAIEVGLISPPFGISVFTVKSSLVGTSLEDSVTVEDIFKGSFPFLLTMLVLIVLLIAFPAIVTYLPNMMRTAL
jgi:C4-dicarboxylate transporter DctM subunit